MRSRALRRCASSAISSGVTSMTVRDLRHRQPLATPLEPIREDGSMHVTGIVANLAVPDINAARDFYTDYLGLGEGFNLGWVAQFRSPDGRAVVQLVTRDATAPHDSVISVH